MQYLRNISNISRTLFSVLVVCMVFLFSAHSFAKSDSHSSLAASHVNAELSSIELCIDHDDSCDSALLYKNNISFSVFGQKVVFVTFDYISLAKNHSINVRAPPLN